MPPDRHLLHTTPGQPPTYQDVQQLIEAERGLGAQGIIRTWQASDSDHVVLTSDAAGVKISRDNGATAPAQVIVDGTTAGGALTGSYPNPTVATATLNALIPPGTIWAYGGAAAPAGWLLCDGSLLGTATYPLLFAAIGYRYGGSGANFNLPDSRGRVVLGASASHPLGQVGGSETAPGPAHTHTGSHHHGLNGHIHPMNGHTHTSAGHLHSILGHGHDVDINHNHGAGTGGGSGPTHNFTSVGSGVTMVEDVHGHTVTVGATGPFTVHSTGPTVSFDTASTTPGATGAPNLANTLGPTVGVTDTADDSTAPAAVYGGTTVPTLPPFVVANAIIRIGV